MTDQIKWQFGDSPVKGQMAMETDRPKVKMVKEIIDRREECGTIAEFLNRYYKPERYPGRNKQSGWDDDYAATLLKSHQDHYKNDGFDLISHHDSVTGNTEYFGTPPWGLGYR